MLFQPGTFRLKNINNLKPPKNVNIQAVMKLMKVKELKNNHDPFSNGRKRCFESSERAKYVKMIIEKRKKDEWEDECINMKNEKAKEINNEVETTKPKAMQSKVQRQLSSSGEILPLDLTVRLDLESKMKLV